MSFASCLVEFCCRVLGLGTVVVVHGVGQARPGFSAGASAGPPQSDARTLALPTGSFSGVILPGNFAHQHNTSSMLLFLL